MVNTIHPTLVPFSAHVGGGKGYSCSECLLTMGLLSVS